MDDQSDWPETQDLETLRARIDDVDRRIVELLNERAKVVVEIGKVKHATGQPIYVPAREKIVLQRVCGYNTGPLPDSVVRAVYRELISGSRALEKPTRVCFLGPRGTFSEAAAVKQFGTSSEFVLAGTLTDIFDIVERGRADYGVVPIENSTQGGITETLARFLSSPLKVCGEIVMRIQLSLLGRGKLEDVRRVYSKGAALAQCREWLYKHLPNVELLETASTAAAAEKAAREENAAAVGREELAAEHGLELLYESIEDFPNNFTRFFVLGEQTCGPTGRDKTALLCSVRDRPGALHNLLTPFKVYDLNITKIESFPSPRAPFQYFFFIDFDGHTEDEKVKRTLEAVSNECQELRVLGTFPKETPEGP